MLTARITVTKGERRLNEPHFQNWMLKRLNEAWGREAHIAKKNQFGKRYWKVAEGYAKGTYHEKKAKGAYDAISNGR